MDAEEDAREALRSAQEAVAGGNLGIAIERCTAALARPSPSAHALRALRARAYYDVKQYEKALDDTKAVRKYSAWRGRAQLTAAVPRRWRQSGSAAPASTQPAPLEALRRGQRCLQSSNCTCARQRGPRTYV